jgi:integrase
LENCISSSESFLKNYSYQQLLDYGTDCRTGEITAGTNLNAQVNNTRHALLKFLKVKNLAIDSRIGEEFGILFDESLAEAASTIKNSNSKKKFLFEIRKWKSYYAGLLQKDNLPPDFASALNFLMETSGTTYSQLASLFPDRKDLAGILIKQWAKYSREPAYRSLPIVYGIEQHFGLPFNTLAGRVTYDYNAGNAVALRKDEFSHLTAHRKYLVAKHLPMNFSLLSIDEQKECVSIICSDFDQKNPYRQLLSESMRNPYRLKGHLIPVGLNEEIEKVTEFKTAEIPPFPYKRKKGARWSVDPEQAGTVGIFITMVKNIGGVLVLPSDKGGLGVPLERLTLAMIMLPQSWRAYMSFMTARQGKLPVNSILRQLTLLYPFLQETYGWIMQSPWLAERLRSVPGLLTAEEVEFAESDWGGFVQKVATELNEILTGLEELSEDGVCSRDSHRPILPILESESPLSILRNAIIDYQDHLPSRHVAPQLNAQMLRNIVFLRILSETALRRKNMVRITWNEDNTGHLRRLEDGHYGIKIPHTEFKNSNSSYFGPKGRKHPYEIKLSKSVTPWIDEYLSHARNFMIEQRSLIANGSKNEPDEGFLFISSQIGKHQRLSYASATIIVQNFSERYLVYNSLTGRGIRGVETFRIHAVRHIVATHVLKQTGSFADAGVAIQDSEFTARKHYARYLPSDRDKKIRKIIIDLMDEEPADA